VTERSFLGSYCEALPGGQYAVLLPNIGIETHRGRVLLPNAQDLLQLRIFGDKLAGIGHRDDRAWEWTGQWADRGMAFGPNSVIYDFNGQLHHITGPPPVGYRYVREDGQIVTCESTYADVGRKIWEYTTRGDLTIGQGGKGPLGEDPCIAILPDKSYRLISVGQCRFVRFNRTGDRLAIAFWRQDTHAAHLRWLTIAELAALPVYIPANAPQSPQPEPEPPPMSIPNHLDVVQAARNKFADLSGPQRANAIVNEVAYQLRAEGAGTFYKPSGSNYNERSLDIIIFKPDGETFDVLGNAEGDARPQWSRSEPTGFGDVTNWREGVPVQVVEPPPPPPPPPPPVDPGVNVKAELTAIRDRINALLARL